MTSQKSNEYSKKQSRMSRIIKIRGILLGLAAAVVAYYYQMDALSFKTDLDITDVPQLFGYLILIALFVERAIELLLALWRSAEADSLDRNIEKLKERMAKISDNTEAEKEAKRQIMTEIELAEDDRVDFKAESRLAAIWTGMVIGVIISTIGVRILGSIFEDPVSSHKIHMGLFIVVDVFLTGFVLAGGSGAIHKIMTLYDSAMTRATENNKAKKGQS
ncbi:MAG: hypothetical protein IH598_12265 [Bacteroidales bacterium]|nr:hypothetical protein [Bacteroidales bacterium]